MVQDVGISESEGETTATKASKRCDPSGNASVSAGVVGYRRAARFPRNSVRLQLFFFPIHRHSSRQSRHLPEQTNWFTQKFLQLYTFLSHMYLCLRSLKFVAAQELQRVLERGPEGQQDKTGTEVITAMQSNVLQHRCASRKRHASQCTTIDDIIWQYLIKFVHSRFCLELPRVQKTNWKGTCIKEPTSQSASGCSTKRSKR